MSQEGDKRYPRIVITSFRCDNPMTEEMTEARKDFKNTLEVLGWLRAEGYKIGKSKIYADAKAGLLPVGPCSVADAERYARRARLKRVAAVSAADIDRAVKEKAELEIKHLQLKNAQLEHDLEVARGKYVTREAFEQELAARAVALKQGLVHLARSRAPEIVAVGRERGDEEAAALLQELIEELLDDYARRDVLMVLDEEATT